MQKEQKHVTKLVLVCTFLLSNYIFSQHSNKDSYYFVEKIIQITKKTDDSTYFLSRDILKSNSLVKKYYNFRFNKKPFFTDVTYDSINNNIGYDTLSLKKNIIKWEKEYKLLDSTFSKADILNIINTKIKTKKWDSSNEVFKKIKFPIRWCDSDLFCDNYISLQYYNKSKNVALVKHRDKGAKTTFYIFEKEKMGWSLIDTITSIVR